MIKLPQYTSKDTSILLWTITPFTVILNSIIFNGRYYTEGKTFLLATLITFVVMSISFILYGNIAVALRQRFSEDRIFLKRITMLILLFLLMTALILFGMLSIYTAMGLLDSINTDNAFTWAYVTTGILNIFLTFLNEGIYRFESWKNDLNETEQLKVAYKQSQLMGLKSQINPHVLFNSLNSLSGLIQEDTDKAEKFLDEMSKVYRYMLRNEEEQLVALATEIQFIQSYFALLKARYNEAIQLTIRLDEADLHKRIPPLSLQVIIENAIFQNIIGKDSPLNICIFSGENQTIVISNNVQRKVITETIDYEAGLDNLVKKYRLMNELPVVIKELEKERHIVLPLIGEKEEVLS